MEDPVEVAERAATGSLASTHGDEVLKDLTAALAAEYVQSNSVAMIAFHQTNDKGKGKETGKSGSCPVLSSTRAGEGRRKKPE